MTIENSEIRKWIIQSLNCLDFEVQEEIQKLWSGYGHILRLKLYEGKSKKVILKMINPPLVQSHPRGWAGEVSHARKLKSYNVEKTWYTNFAPQCFDSRIPLCYGTHLVNGDILILLEDLDESKYSLRHQSLSFNESKECIKWLANFHAKFMDVPPVNLWQEGSYWHLETRPDEFAAMSKGWLKTNAHKLDKALKEARYQTLIHGDAKIANFCFSKNFNVAAVDFQYVGRGVGMKDLAYFMGSCFSEFDCHKHEENILDYYFNELQNSLAKLDVSIDFEEVEKEWRTLFPIAWADFSRFLKGWAPEHEKINSYSDKQNRMARRLINS